MKKVKLFKNVVVAFLVVVLFNSMILPTNFVAKATTTPVQLASAKFNTSSDQGVIKGYYASGYVSLANIAPTKKVTIHYTNDDVTWSDVAATYQNNDPSGNDIWYFETPVINNGSSTYCKFCIKYEVNGNTYWDNNNNNNYVLNNTTSPYALGNKALTLGSADRTTNITSGLDTVTGSIALKNIAYAKTVNVIYSTDNWTTSNQVNATYNFNYSSNLENWGFVINNIPSSSNISYYLKYTVNGSTYYDNNFGTNYTSKPIEKPLIANGDFESGTSNAPNSWVSDSWVSGT